LSTNIKTSATLSANGFCVGRQKLLRTQKRQKRFIEKAAAVNLDLLADKIFCWVDMLANKIFARLTFKADLMNHF